MHQVEIKPLANEELEALEGTIDHDWGNPIKHKTRLAMQQRDELVYLIAWVAGKPVGHAVLEWAGKVHDAFIDKIANCPNIDDLFVGHGYRSKGIGSDLLNRAQDLAVQQGYRYVGLGVRTDNWCARRLYKQLGYMETRIGEYLDSWQYIDKSGCSHWYQESCYYLVKTL